MMERKHKWIFSAGLFLFLFLVPVLAEEIPLDSGELQRYADVALLEKRLDDFEAKLNNNLLNIVELNKQTLAGVKAEMQGMGTLTDEVVTMKTLFLTLVIAQVCLSFAVSTFLLNRRIGKLQKQYEGLIMWVINKLEADPKTFKEFTDSLPESSLWDSKASDVKQDFKLVKEKDQASLPKVKPELDERIPFADISEKDKMRIRKKTKEPKKGGRIGNG